MAVRILYDGAFAVHFHILNLDSVADPHLLDWDFDDTVGGQNNGLCGAAVPGHLSVWAVPHTARVAVRVELHAVEPIVDPMWEEVVEVSFEPLTPAVGLSGFEGPNLPILLPAGQYRVRYCCNQLDCGDRQDPDRSTHLLQFWPALSAPDRVERQTSADAASMHQRARQSPPSVAAAQLRHAVRREAARTPPEDAPLLVGLDRKLARRIAAARAPVQRRLAVFAAEQACLTAFLESDWVTAGLRALADDQPLPPPFTDRPLLDAMLAAVPNEADRPDVEVRNGRPMYAGHHGTPMRVAAIDCIYAAAQENPRGAALDAAWASAITHGGNYPMLLQALANEIEFLNDRQSRFRSGRYSAVRVSTTQLGARSCSPFAPTGSCARLPDRADADPFVRAIDRPLRSLAQAREGAARVVCGYVRTWSWMWTPRSDASAAGWEASLLADLRWAHGRRHAAMLPDQ